MTSEIGVLHVDDEPDFAEMASQFLTRTSDRIRVATAHTADGALQRIEERQFDCVVSDYDMPDRTGLDFLEAVREESPELPFILFTGKGSEEIASDAISMGVTDYLQKRHGTDQYVILANRIENAVDKIRAERRAEESRALYRSLTEDALDTSDVGTVILDAEFHVVWVNSAIETYFDIDRGEIIGQDNRALVEDQFAPLFEAPDQFAETVTATYADNSYVEEFECHLPAAEGRDERWLRHWSQPIETGHFAGGRIEHYTDITEYKAREQEIARLNELHETVLANIRDTVLLTDPAGRFTYICPNVEYIFGYDREEVAQFGTIEGLLGEQLVEYETLSEQGELHNIETSIEDRAGQEHQLLATVTAVEMEAGSCLYSIRDITDLVDRERAYRELSRRHELALEATDTGVWEWNIDTNEVIWSEALERLLGIEPGTFEGTFEAYERYLHPEAEATVQRAAERALDGHGEFDEDFRMIRADGEVIWVHGQGELVTEDGPPRMLGITTEITERKAREQELREEQHFIDTALNTIADIFYVISPDGEFLRWNDELPAATGYSDAEIEAMKAAEFFDGEDIDRIEAFFEEVIETGEAVVEANVVTKDGQSIPYASRGRKLPDADGELVGIAGISRDIRDRKGREERLKRQNERLEEFARIVSHDLRNPLTVAEGHLELVQEEVESEALDAIDRAHERMNDLIDDLLTLAREGESIRDVEPVALDSFVQECWHTIDQAAAAFEADTELVLEADRSRLRQLVENLLRNAVEHGGADVTISIGRLPDGFYVADDGPGIPEADREAVFEDGFSTTHEGTGYGLGIVEDVVAAHGWEIRITDGTAGGARFEITGVDPIEDA